MTMQRSARRGGLDSRRYRSWLRLGVATAALWGLGFGAAHATSLPFEETFDTSGYANDYVRITGGATHQWLPNGGWRGGAARFTPPTVDQQYSGLGQFTGLNTSNAPFKQLNVRFLIYHGRTYASLTPGRNKLLILNRVDPQTNERATRAILTEWKYDSRWVTYGPCHNIVCIYEGGDNWPTGSERYRLGTGPSERSEEWISVEFEADILSGEINLYIHTQDGVHNGLYVSQSMDVDENAPNDLQTVWQYIDMLGGYFNYSSPSDPDNYFMFDELRIDNQYIGPPAGFLADPPPGAPALGGASQG
jgi:hypothetical protein